MRKSWIGRFAAVAMTIAVAPAQAQEAGTLGKAAIRIGILNDRSGPYADVTGEGSAVAARMAALEFNNKIDGVPIEILVGDHMNKPDIGANIARRWFENDQVDAIADVANSGVGFAVAALAKERNKIFLNNSGSVDFTGKTCSPTNIQWAFNAYAVAKSLAAALLKEKLDKWFIVGADYAFSRSLAASLRQFAEAGGGKVVGEVFHPLNTADFASYLLQAQSSGANVIVTANSGADLVTMIKQAAEFGVTKTHKMALATPINLSEIEALGPDLAQGLLSTSAFEWTRSQQSREWTKRFVASTGKFPNADQAATYSAVRAYLGAIAATKTLDATRIVEKMRETQVDDAYANQAHLRRDGQFIHDLFLVRLKSASESTEKGDYTTILQTLEGNDVYQPLSQSECSLVGKK
jgi:branched-chain amino acid transport system substrate-binding protein